jgi:hypothetical protein
MKRVLGILQAVVTIAASTPGVAVAEIIPANRRMNWVPGVTVGVPGGIPNRTNIFVNVKTTVDSRYRCAGDGVTDDSLRLQAAMVACPSNQVIYVPAGTYIINQRVLVQNNQHYTLRGDGQGRTIFRLTGGAGQFRLGAEQYPRPMSNEVSVTAGAVPGSSVLTTTNTVNVRVGNFITLWMQTPSWMHTLLPNNTDAGRVFKMTFKVTAKTTNTVGITPPVPFNVSGMNPRIIPWGMSGGGHVTSGVGFENLTVDALNGFSTPIRLEQAWGCWFKNIEVRGTSGRQMFLFTTCASEVRDCYTHDTQGSGPNHEGIDFMNDGCWNLIENNVCIDGGKPAIILGDAEGGCVGNVIAYNYVVNVEELGEMFNAGIQDSHGAGGNTLNLLEGNVVPGFNSDGYFGGSSYGTLFRNFIHNKFDGGSSTAVVLDHYAVYYNIVGNILGSPDMTSSYDSETSGAARTLIYRLGFPNVGNFNYGGGTEGSPNPAYGNLRTIGPTTPPNYSASPNRLTDAQALDLNVKATILRHGNFDYANRRVLWDATIADGGPLLGHPSDRIGTQ